MYIQRTLEKEIKRGVNSFPVVTLTGPRQSGKTTLLKHLFPKMEYISLENPDILMLAKNDPVGFLNNLKSSAILDEVQKVPELLSYIQGIVDEVNDSGMFILSGSQQFNLMSGITQSLAGRTAIYKLFPFTFSEVGVSKSSNLNELMLKGFYPRLWSHNIDPYRLYADYIETYVERDLRQIVNIRDLDKFRLFIRLCAGRVGQLFTSSNLANETGVSVHTINSWLSILETSYIIFKLPPYYSNINKRLIKSFKIYFYDTGLACSLLGITRKEHLQAHPLRGALFENLVIAEAVKTGNNRGIRDRFYFYRDSNHNEVDLIVDYVTSIDAYEIKSSETFHPSLLKGLNYIRKIFSKKTAKTVLCYAGKQELKYQDHKLIHFSAIPSNIQNQ
jgi:predicted AAA+ superfamily ATPase